jgi:hypothetical protein
MPSTRFAVKSDGVIGSVRCGGHPATYREVMIGRTTYCVTSVFTGEKELGPTLEKLAVQSVLDEIEGQTKAILRA